MNVTLYDKDNRLVEYFTGVKTIGYDDEHDRFTLIFSDSANNEKVWANGGSLKVEV